MDEVDGGPRESQSMKDTREVEAASLAGRIFHIHPPSSRDKLGPGICT